MPSSTPRLCSLIHDETGADIVPAEIGNGVLGTADLAEVIVTMVHAELDVNRQLSYWQQPVKD